MSDVTCRGSFALGTACGKCSRCRREVESYNAMKAVRDKLNTPSSALTRIEELEAKLRWVLDERDVTFALMLKRAETAEAKLAMAVEALEKIAKFDHQKEAQRILTMTVEQPAAMHLRAEKSEGRVQAEYQLIKSVAQTDIQCWAHMAITELKGGKDE